MEIKDVQKIEEYYQALVARDQSYVGIFFVGVKTTSIFCIASCRARKPKFENTVFYTDFKDALDHGFRPCKICKPTEHAHQAPEFVESAIKMVTENPKQKIKDYQLRQAGISPEKLRRWFNKHYGMTFQSFQRMYRINNAYTELKNGKNTAESAYGVGYESLSGFAYTFKKLLGQAPHRMEHEPIKIQRLTTPLGPMFVCATEKGICLLEFVDRRMLESEFQDLQKRLHRSIIIGENEHIIQLKKELKQYFEGQRSEFEISLHLVGTAFQQLVWQALRTIPAGQTRSYQEQARLIHKPNAVRAVASANGYNKIAIIIPCHRVIGSDGQLRGYGGGLERKAWLLRHEAAL